MKYYAHIYQGYVAGIGVFPDDAPLPQDHVDVTDEDPMPQRWWFYNEYTGVFSPSTPPPIKARTVTGKDIFEFFSAGEWNALVDIIKTGTVAQAGGADRFKTQVAGYWDTEIPITSAKLITYFAGLVTLGVLTQARRDEFFA